MWSAFAFWEIEDEGKFIEAIDRAFTKDYLYNLNNEKYTRGLFFPRNEAILEMLEAYIGIEKPKDPVDKPVSCRSCSLLTEAVKVCSVCNRRYCSNCVGDSGLLKVLNDSEIPPGSEICKTCGRLLKFMSDITPRPSK